MIPTFAEDDKQDIQYWIGEEHRHHVWAMQKILRSLAAPLPRELADLLHRKSRKIRTTNIFDVFLRFWGIFMVNYGKDRLKSSGELFCFNLNLKLFGLLM